MVAFAKDPSVTALKIPGEESRDDKPRLLTYRQAAHVLQVSDRTVWGLVHEKRLPAVRIGSLVRIDSHDLESFIQGAKSRPGQREAAADVSPQGPVAPAASPAESLN